MKCEKSICSKSQNSEFAYFSSSRGTYLAENKNTFQATRVFSNDELKETFESKGFKKFLNKAENLFQDVQDEGDIMGNIKQEVHSFYMRDYVEEKVAALFIGNIATIVILTCVTSA